MTPKHRLLFQGQIHGCRWIYILAGHSEPITQGADGGGRGDPLDP